MCSDFLSFVDTDYVSAFSAMLSILITRARANSGFIKAAIVALSRNKPEAEFG